MTFQQQGHCDYPLTELGISQAIARGASLKDENWDVVFSSDLFRAFNTTKIILAQQSVRTYSDDSIKQTPLLRELSFGVREGLSRALTTKECIAEVALRRNIPVEDVFDTAESMQSVLQRQAEFLARLKYLCLAAQQNKRNGELLKVLCVAHGGFIGHFLRNFCPTLVREKPKIGNCSLSIITIEWPADDKVVNAEEVELVVAAARDGKYDFTCIGDAAHFNMCIE